MAEWIKKFAFDAKTEVYKETVRLSEQIKNCRVLLKVDFWKFEISADLKEDCKTAALGALEVNILSYKKIKKKLESQKNP